MLQPNAQTEVIAVTTDSSGDADVDGVVYYTGWLSHIVFTDTDLDAGSDLVVKTQNRAGTVIQTILTIADMGASAIWAPRHPTNSRVDGAAITNGEGRIYLVNERLNVVIANGGDTKSGSFRFYIATS